MNYFLFSLLALLIILSGCAILGGSMASGEEVLEGTGQGHRGPVTVQVRMNGTHITDIVVVDSAEDHFVGGTAMEELIDMVIMYNTTDLDAVSGATGSSKGFLEAVENAILKR